MATLRNRQRKSNGQQNVNNIRDKVVLELVTSSVTTAKFSDYLVSKMYTSPLEVQDLAYPISSGLK